MEKFKKAIPGLFFLLVAAIFFIGTFSIKQTTSGNMAIIKAPTYPRMMIGFLAVMALYVLVQDLLWTSGKNSAETDGAVKPLLLCIGATLLSILLIKTVGVVIIGTAFLLSTFLLLERQPLTKRLVIRRLLLSLLLSVAFSYLFRYGFGIRLPMYPF